MLRWRFLIKLDQPTMMCQTFVFQASTSTSNPKL